MNYNAIYGSKWKVSAFWGWDSPICPLMGTAKCQLGTLSVSGDQQAVHFFRWTLYPQEEINCILEIPLYLFLSGNNNGSLGWHLVREVCLLCLGISLAEPHEWNTDKDTQSSGGWVQCKTWCLGVLRWFHSLFWPCYLGFWGWHHSRAICSVQPAVGLA